MIKSDSIRRCEKKYIWCVNKIFVAITKIFVVSTLNKGWGTGISWMWVWSDDVTTTAPKSAKSPKSPMFFSTNHQNLPDPPFYLLVLLSVGWKPESLNTCSVVAVILFPSIGHSNKVWETFTRKKLGGNFWVGRSRQYSFVCLYNSSVIDNIDNKIKSQNLVSYSKKSE